MMPGVQIVNMRPPTPTAQGQPKTVATVSPRVVITNPTRPTNSGVIWKSILFEFLVVNQMRRFSKTNSVQKPIS